MALRLYYVTSKVEFGELSWVFNVYMKINRASCNHFHSLLSKHDMKFNSSDCRKGDGCSRPLFLQGTKMFSGFLMNNVD